VFACKRLSTSKSVERSLETMSNKGDWKNTPRRARTEVAAQPPKRTLGKHPHTQVCLGTAQ